MPWLFIILSLQLSFAEYRVYELQITNTKTQKSRKVYSTLDWIQYRDYHHLSRDEEVYMTDHWMCWKRADFFKPLCQRPVTEEGLKSEALDQEISSL